MQISKLAVLAAAGCVLGPAQGLRLERLGSYRTGTFDRGAAEIAAYDPQTRRLFVVNGAIAGIDMLDISTPSAPRLHRSLRVPGDIGGSPNSVAVHNGLVAVAAEASNRQEPGAVIFYNSNGELLKFVRVGAVPDMVTFTPDGQRVLVANEGEPSPNYATHPEGSVSIIDLSRGIGGVSQESVSTVRFTEFNNSRVGPAIRIFGPRATVAQDLEPEYIAVSRDSRTAWVTLQENNAIAEIDIQRGRVIRLLPLGLKDHSKEGNGLDASDRDNGINIRNWPVHGLYMPDAIAAFETGGRTYLITANEGDAREYDEFVEERRVSAVRLDPEKFPNAAELQRPENLGRLTISSASGDTDGDGDFDELHVFGGRSFSIWSTDGTLVYDSGDQLEQITARETPREFNSDASGGLDTRSDNKGPEPEAVAVAAFGGRTYAFIGLERIGGIMVFDVTTPSAPQFVQYMNARIEGGSATADTAGDHGPEGIIVIPAADSPTNEPLLVVANEVSGSTTVYRIALPESTLVARVTPENPTTASSEIELDGSTSTGTDLRYNWRSVGPRGVSLIGANQPKVRVQFGAGFGDYTIELTVQDPPGKTDTKQVKVNYAISSH